MRTNTAIALAWIALLAAVVTGCSNRNAEASGGGDRATLEIKGNPGTEFTGSCTLGDGQPTKIGGEVPRSFTYDLEGKPLKCEISSHDNLRVDFSVGEKTHSAQSISGGTLYLAYDHGSISTHTSSSSRSSGRGSSTSQASSSTEGSGGKTGEPGTKESRSVSGFDQVELRGVGNLSIEQTGHESLRIDAEKSVVPKITSRVVNGRLIIGPNPNSAIQTTGPINYTLTVKDLRSLEVLGSANVEATGIETDRLAVTIRGTGNVRLNGKADEQKVDISGTGTYLAENLESREVEINVAGAGSAIVNAKKKLDAQISGVGSIEYVGNPKIQQSVSGAGHIVKH